MPDSIKIIIYMLSFQGIITSLILFLNRNVRTTHNKYLVLFVLVFSLYLLGQNLFWGRFYMDNPHFLFATIAFPLLFGPLLYLYMMPVEKRRYSGLHFVPFLVLVALHIPFYAWSAEEKNHFYNSMIVTREVNLKFYLYRMSYVLQILIYYFIIRKEILSKRQLKTYEWYRILGIFYLSMGVAYLIQMGVYALYDMVKLTVTYFALFYILMAVFILYFVTKTLLAPELFRSGSKYIRSLLSEEQRILYSEQIISVMETERIFLNKDLRLVDLAHKTNATEHQLSQVLSEHFGVNFFEFINSYRINTAKQLLLDSGFKHFTIDAIAEEVGFKSKSSFYEAFKKFVGLTPFAFKRQHLPLLDSEE